VTILLIDEILLTRRINIEIYSQIDFYVTIENIDTRTLSSQAPFELRKQIIRHRKKGMANKLVAEVAETTESPVGAVRFFLYRETMTGNVKRKIHPVILAASNHDLAGQTLSFMKILQKRSCHVKQYFKHPSVSYAAIITNLLRIPVRLPAAPFLPFSFAWGRRQYNQYFSEQNLNKKNAIIP